MSQVIKIADYPDLIDAAGQLLNTRSGAKRIKANFCADEVVLDFSDIVGASPVSRSFFDELFRVSRIENVRLKL